MTPRVLIVHNMYRSDVPSGENNVVTGQIALLRQAGVEVETYLRSSDEIADFSLGRRLELGIRPIFSREDVSKFEAVVDGFQPDVVHVHNLYPLISPAVVSRAKSRGCRVVQTMHNFRHYCAAGTFFRDGVKCTDCVGRRFPWPAVVHGCYRGSRAESLALGAAIFHHHNTWLLLDRLLPVSDFVADQLAVAGVSRERMTVVPNCVPDPGSPAALGEGFLFVGRLDVEKGIVLLLEAWKRSGLGTRTELVVVGDGPERARVESAAAELDGLHYVGPAAPEEVQARMRRARTVVVPSIWIEALPTVVLEAYASGRPVLATKIGSLETLVTTDVGWHGPLDADGLAAALRDSWSDPDAAAKGRRARDLYHARFTADRVLDQLLKVYRSPSAGLPSRPVA